MMLIATDKHKTLKAGVIVHEETNPEGMHLADAHYVMAKPNGNEPSKLWYESKILKAHIELKYIKIIQ